MLILASLLTLHNVAIATIAAALISAGFYLVKQANRAELSEWAAAHEETVNEAAARQECGK